MARDHSGLGAGDWNRIVLDNHTVEPQAISDQLMKGFIDPLAQPILNVIRDGWSMLELGSGWGTMSAGFATKGHSVAMLDWSPEIVSFGQHLLDTCGLCTEAICADLFSSLPFADKSYDCVWSSGVLEHFAEPYQLAILRESARVARHMVISQVPNSFSIPYRVGKLYMEKTGTWEFGYEQPVRTQRKVFELAGLVNIRETAADSERAAWFLESLPGSTLMRRIWYRLCREWPMTINTVARQGYMLVTIGEVP